MRLGLKPTRYGLQHLKLTLTHNGDSATYHRTFAYLHPDTREHSTWEKGRGSIFGFWPLGGGHDTPPAEKELPVMAAAGAETSTRNYDDAPPELRALAEKYHFISEAAFHSGSIYYSTFTEGYPGGLKFDASKPDVIGKAFVDAVRKIKHEPSAISRPTFLAFFAEPNVGNIATGIWPGHYGEEYQLTASEKEIFNDLLAKFLVAARAVRKEWPDVKLLLPYGDPMNTALFLRFAPETRELIDGVALDLPEFERTPEQQINQVVLNRLYPIMKDIKQYIKDPYLVLTEGNAVSSKDFDTGEQGQADVLIRNFLVMMGYGVSQFEAGISPWDCANYWGENHYGGGWNTRQPVAMPKPAYIQYATMTRHLNRANFTKYVPTGSTSVYCQQYKHYRDGHLVHALWTVRGKRPVSVRMNASDRLEVFDANDNGAKMQPKDGLVTFIIGQSPVYLEGLSADAVITLGESDHSDASPGKVSVKVANLGDGSWKISTERDEEYETNKPLQIERFPGNMSVQQVKVPATHGGDALAVHLGRQEKDRGLMPYYTTLQPKSGVAIPGKASHLGLWVKAASDWGRVVYTVRDAKGEKWISVGTKQEWNNDDIHTWSAFNFDGWRYMKFQMPSNLPYDSFRERGSSWWGSYGGDGIVDLPLSLEKIMVERRPRVIYGNELETARPDDVLLGELRAEYAAAGDETAEAVRQSRLRMPLPQTAPALENPIAELARTGTGPATTVLRVTDPTMQYDGTRVHVHFTTVPGAQSYDVWVSPYADGRGAMKLGSGWTESGGLIQGLRPATEFYAFVVYTDRAGKLSKPSAPLKFTLTSRFGYK